MGQGCWPLIEIACCQFVPQVWEEVGVSHVGDNAGVFSSTSPHQMLESPVWLCMGTARITKLCVQQICLILQKGADHGQQEQWFFCSKKRQTKISLLLCCTCCWRNKLTGICCIVPTIFTLSVLTVMEKQACTPVNITTNHNKGLLQKVNLFCMMLSEHRSCTCISSLCTRRHHSLGSFKMFNM